MSSTLLRTLPRALPRALPASSRAALRFASSASAPKSDGKAAKSEIAKLPPKPPTDKQKFKAPEKDTTFGALGQVNLPDTTEVEINVDLKIPTMPDSYVHPPPSEELPPPSESTPKVHLVTDASTHLEGGPRQGTSGDDVQHGESGDAIPFLEGEPSKPLTGEERSGLLALGGIVVGGLLLSKITQPRSHAVGKEVAELHNK